MIFVRPAPGLIVLHPESRKPLKTTGEPVPLDPYWLRRLGDRDVLEGAAPADADQTAPADAPSAAPAAPAKGASKGPAKAA